MAVHSTQLGASSSIPIGGSTLYTVPTGKRAIVKSMQMLNLAAVANRVVIHIGLASGGAFEWVITLGALGGTTDSVDHQTWFVLNAGDTLQIRPQNGSIECMASGAVLTV